MMNVPPPPSQRIVTAVARPFDGLASWQKSGGPDPARYAWYTREHVRWASALMNR